MIFTPNINSILIFTFNRSSSDLDLHKLKFDKSLPRAWESIVDCEEEALAGNKGSREGLDFGEAVGAGSRGWWERVLGGDRRMNGRCGEGGEGGGEGMARKM